ncbi:hypothetical protein [Saccharomonospora sp. NB11]|uniref:hypothetical protein n=1 Tax=Saccharomonospora sp. NB11 TaxID=1642298 RepID=UPI0018D112C6|nr:hypothetical protein [Saccharomonospora sp. NB11]
MPISDLVSPAPRQVRLAGALTALPGLALLAFGVLLAVNAGDEPAMTGNNVAAEIAYYVVLAAGVLACAVALLFGKTWARSPSLVVNLVVIGMGWYATGPSNQPGFGVPVMIVGAVVIVLLFQEPSRAWVLGQRPGESEEEAARRGGAAGRAAEREQRGE